MSPDDLHMTAQGVADAWMIPGVARILAVPGQLPRNFDQLDNRARWEALREAEYHNTTTPGPLRDAAPFLRKWRVFFGLEPNPYRAPGTEYSANDIGNIAQQQPQVATVRGMVASEPFRTPGQHGPSLTSRDVPPRATARMVVTGIRSGGGSWQAAGGNIRTAVRGDALAGVYPGDTIEVTGRFGQIPTARNPGEYDVASHWRQVHQARAQVVARDAPNAVRLVRSAPLFEQALGTMSHLQHAISQGLINNSAPQPDRPTRILGIRADVTHPGQLELPLFFHPAGRAAKAAEMAGSVIGIERSDVNPPGAEALGNLLGIQRPSSSPSPQLLRQLDINTASPAEIAQLPFMRPELAREIIADRDANGPFRSLADLRNVRGMGPSNHAAIVPFLASPEEGSVPSERWNADLEAEERRRMRGTFLAMPELERQQHAEVIQQIPFAERTPEQHNFAALHDLQERVDRAASEAQLRANLGVTRARQPDVDQLQARAEYRRQTQSSRTQSRENIYQAAHAGQYMETSRFTQPAPTFLDETLRPHSWWHLFHLTTQLPMRALRNLGNQPGLTEDMTVAERQTLFNQQRGLPNPVPQRANAPGEDLMVSPWLQSRDRLVPRQALEGIQP